MKNRAWIALGFVLFCLALMLLVSLGFWQLGRAEEKQRVLDQIEEAKHAESSDYSELRAFPADSARLNYRSLRLIGDWQPEQQFLLSNRIYLGELGEEVLTPFRLQDGNWLLVNRGWRNKEALLPGLDRQAIPEGLLYFPEPGYQMGEAILDSAREHEWVETLYLDIPAIAGVLDQNLVPAVLVLTPSANSGLVRIWQAVSVEPARHIAYAVQWFGLSLALFVFGVVWLRRMRRK